MGKRTLHGEWHHLTGDDLPPKLMELAEPPKELWALGDPHALHLPGVAIVGARKCTAYGRACASKFARVAAESGYAVVSGGARGVDGQAHDSALDAGGMTVAVLAGGIDWCYPNEHAPLFQLIIDNGGAIVSEQRRGVEPEPWMFPRRNRIIAGLSQAMLVVECKVPSGTLTACNHMMSLNRPLLAVPGSIFAEQSAGCNHLIAERLAHAVHDVESFGRWLR